MLITCTGCPARGKHCEGCMVMAMQDLPMPVMPQPEWEEEDFRVLDVLCDSGLVSAQEASQARLERSSYSGLRAVG